MSDNTAEQDRIERDLARTRSRMDTRLSELQERLTPGQIVDDLMGYFRGSEGGEFARNLMASVRSNPMPAALTGIGLTWLMASNPRSANSELHTEGDDPHVRVRNAERGVVRQTGETDDVYLDRLEDARGTALGLPRNTGETADSYGKRIKDGLAAAKQTVASGVDTAREKVGTAAGQVSSAAQSAASSVGGAARSAGDTLAQGGHATSKAAGNLVSAITDNPVLLGVVGLAAGALLGALVPQSREEEDALGGIADKARGTARDAAQSVVDRGGAVARQAIGTAHDTARNEGLTKEMSVGGLAKGAQTGDLAASIKQVAQETLQAASDAAGVQEPDQRPS